MKSNASPLIIFLCAMLYWCAPVKLNLEYDKTVDFGSYSTYSIHPEMQSGLSEA